MKDNRMLRLDRIMRSLHLYAGLFLVPWMLVYGTSAFCLNHVRWLKKHFKMAPPRWEFVREIRCAPDETFPEHSSERARAILKRLDLDGPHYIESESNTGQMTILRYRATGDYRVMWHPQRSMLAVEKQPFSLYRLVNFLHFRHGYSRRYLRLAAWAAVVDMAAVSMWLWAISGIYIWVRGPRKRFSGGIALLGGCLLFIVLTVLFCL